jgi:putative tryptophan/tyrosine transport system substrate-binding protein
MNRRQFFLLASVAGLPSSVAGAQPTPKALKVGVLVNGGPGPVVDILQKNFARIGYAEGQGLALEFRYAHGRLDRHRALAAELVQLGVDVIMTLGGPASRAAKDTTSTTPIVFSIVTDPVALGLVASMDRPGGNATGITSLDPEQAIRQFELIRTLLPKVTRVGILSDTTIPGADSSGLAPIERANAAAARQFGIAPLVRKVAEGPSPDYASVLDDLIKLGAEALLVLEVPMPYRDGKTVAELATARRLPTIFPGGQSGTGGLITYGTSVADTWPLMTVLVDRILKGAKPGDLPVQTASKRELIVNLGTARALALTVSDEILKRADRVIG